jgi:hypothetical protein
MARIVSLHGVPKKIILDRGSQFTPKFWKSFRENMDAKLNFSSAYLRLMDQTRGRQFFGPELIQEAGEQVRIIRENLRVAQTRQRSYADNRRRPLEFEERNHVYLKVSPLHGMRRFKIKDKLSPHFIGPFRVFRRVGEMAYQLELSDNLCDVHNVFHVSQLKKCLRVPEEQLPMEELSVQGDLTYTEYPIKILDTLTRVTRNKVIKMCKVQWSHHGEDEAAWEREEELRIDFPIFSLVLPKSRGRDSC